MLSRSFGLVLRLLLCAALGGCTLVKLNDESRAFYASTVLVGRIEGTARWRGPIVVAAWQRQGGGAVQIVHGTWLHRPGGYELIVPPGEVALFAFGDVNGNGVFDEGEPWGEYADGATVQVPGTGVVAGLDLAIEHGHGAPPRLPVGTPFGAAAKRGHSTGAGALADLEASDFSAANGQRGYWAPMEFFRDTGGNVVFVEPYDPGKIPVLFVHGAAGSLQDWRYFIEHIDRRRYQPWVFQYPSGAAVDSMAYLLYWKLLNLQLEHRFDKLYIVAHSMGGLVARSLLLHHGSQLPQARLFVSLSTPWAGEATAELGVKHSPAVVPSWHDMQPEGRFMKALFARPLPPGVEYHLLFGHRGGYSLLRPNNDGTVTLASQLRSPAQAEARTVYGFDEDHVSILSSAQALAQVQAILDGHERRPGEPARSGRVQVDIGFDTGSDGPKGLPALLLKPVEGTAPSVQGMFTISLTSDDAGRSIGPVAAGWYDVSLVAAGFRSEPRRLRVRIGADEAPTLRFRLAAQGTLAGYVGAEQDPLAGPAGSYRPPHPSIQIERITLRGAGVDRTLVPRRSGPEHLLESYLDGADDAHGAGFSFVGLAAGEYELSIRAAGHLPYSARHLVVPGRQGPLLPIVLVRRP